MKKMGMLILVMSIVVGNALCVYAGHVLDKYNKMIEGNWTREAEMTVAGVSHSWFFKESITLPDENVILTEDSAGLVYLTAHMKDDSSEIPTMGILTFSDDDNTMIIKDTIGGILIYRREE